MTNQVNFTINLPRYNLSAVILTSKTKNQIDEALAKIKYYDLIYNIWGFKEVDPGGSCSILNFYGPPGTGKTMAAEAIAGTLGKRFLNLGMSDLESKFLGETAKNIGKAFELAKEKDALLFFDEADTLLGARLSNVSQGIDNEINSLRSTMLLELERFTGIVIFATNFVKNYDRAFVNRITQHINFELPDETARKLLWEKFLVPGIPLADTRDELTTELAKNSNGLSGRAIRTAMRLALPKTIVLNPSHPKLSLEIINASIAQVKAQNCLGTAIPKSHGEIKDFYESTLGIKVTEEKS